MGNRDSPTAVHDAARRPGRRPCAALCYGQTLARIARLQSDDVVIDGTSTSIRFGATAIVLTDPVGRLVRELLARPQGKATTAAPERTPWLFHGAHPGRAITPHALGRRLGSYGIDAREARNDRAARPRRRACSGLPRRPPRHACEHLRPGGAATPEATGPATRHIEREGDRHSGATPEAPALRRQGVLDSVSVGPGEAAVLGEAERAVHQRPRQERRWDKARSPSRTRNAPSGLGSRRHRETPSPGGRDGRLGPRSLIEVYPRPRRCGNSRRSRLLGHHSDALHASQRSVAGRSRTRSFRSRPRPGLLEERAGCVGACLNRVAAGANMVGH